MSRLSAGAVLLALSSAAAHAQPQTPQWSVVFDDGQGVYSPTAADGVRAGNEGAVVNLIRSAASLTPLGQRRWRLGAAELCAASTDTVYVDAVEALPGGEAWVLRRCLGPTGSVPQYGLLRLAADGAVIASTDVGPMPDQSGRARLIAQSGDVVALVPRNGGLRWLHVGPDGQILSDAFNALPGPENYSVAILNAKLWPNGSASVATRQFRSCTTSPPESCPQAAHTLLRLNTDGTERWRFEAGAMSTFIGFDEDGSSLIAQSPSGAPLMLRQVSAAGVPGTPFVAAGGEVMTLSGAAGPVRGRYLAHSDTEHLLLDRDGAVLVRRPQMGSAGGPAFACGEHGFITRVWYSDAALVSADDLSVVARFDIEGVDNDGWDGGGDLHWTLLADGTVYGTARRPGDPRPVRGARLSRFAAPGSPAADLIFVDHLE